MSQKYKILCQEDDKIIEIDRETMKMMNFLGNLLEMTEDQEWTESDDTWPVEISSTWFQKFVDYCKYHIENPDVYEKADNKDPIFMVNFDKEFIEQFMDKSKNHVDLLELYRLAHYLDIEPVRKLVSKKLVTIVYNSKNPNEIRECFGLPKVEESGKSTTDSAASKSA